MRTHGTLVKWNPERGFGFLAVAAGGEQVFVHVSAFPRDGRPPQVGELVSFEIRSGADGRRKAEGVQRPGVRGAARKPEEKPKATPSSLLHAATIIAILAAVGAAAYSRWAPPEPVTGQALAPTPRVQALAAGQAFACDGRTQCSQMRSCAEAQFFLKNCPDTRMDGNNDGEPCEQQWCR